MSDPNFMFNVKAAGPSDNPTMVVKIANPEEIGVVPVGALPTASEAYRNVILRLTTTNVLYYLNAAGDDWTALESGAAAVTSVNGEVGDVTIDAESLSLEIGTDVLAYSATVMDAATEVAEPAADTTATGYRESITPGESVAFGDLLYQKSDGKWWKTDADAATTMPGMRMALETKAADAACKALVYGKARNDAWNWTVGGFIYAGTDAGALTQAAPSGSGDQVQVVGIAYHADKMIFCPSPVLVEIA